MMASMRTWARTTIELGDDVGDGAHVVLVGKDQERVGALVGDDFRVAQDLDFALAGPGGAGAHDVAPGGCQKSCGPAAPGALAPMPVVLPMPLTPERL